MCLRLAFGFSRLGALQQEFCLDLSTGYRHDKMTQVIKSYSPPGTFFQKNHLKAKNISIWEVGVIGSYILDDAWMIKGNAYLGTVAQGRYLEKLTDIFNNSDLTRAHIKKGNTRDFLIGIGYVPTFRDCLGDLCRFGPVAGWSYDYQKVKMHNGKINYVAFEALENFYWEMDWQGPWLGLDAEVRLCDVTVNFNYEYHWATWNSHWILNGPDVPNVAFSDHRKSNKAHGQVFNLETSLDFCDHWEVCLGLKYQKWDAGNGRERPVNSFAGVGLSPDEVDKIKNAHWISWGFHLNVGCFF